MCSVEPELSLVVLVNGKRELVKPFCVVAFGTIGHLSFCQELFVVVILMAIRAEFKFQGSRDACLVARSTGNGEMLAFKPETRFVVIKISDALHCVERNRRVALLAVLSEFILVYIHMAVGASGKLDTGKCLKFHPVFLCDGVAFYTLHSLVASFKRKPCTGMIEFCQRFKCIREVAV